MDILSSTERAFAGEFIRIPPKIGELAEMLWFIFRVGGSAPVSIIDQRFPEALPDLRNMVALGMLKEAGTGSERAFSMTDRFREKLLSKDPEEISSSYIFEMLVSDYPGALVMMYNMGPLVRKLSAAMSAVIENATPGQPARVGRVFREAAEALDGQVTAESLGNAREMIEYYLFRCLGLVEPAGAGMMNLTKKGIYIVTGDARLFEAYRSEPKPVVEEKNEDAAAVSGDEKTGV